MLLNFYLLSALIILLFLPGYIMPCITLWERWTALKTKRSLLDKSAYQINLLSFGLQVLFFCILLADFLFQGVIFQIFKADSLQLFPILLLNSACSAVFSFINLLSKGKGKLSINLISCLLSISTLLFAFLCIVVTYYYIERNGFNQPDILQEIYPRLIQYDVIMVGFLLFTVFLLLLNSAYSHILCWHLIIKNKYEYGRDFYNYVISSRAKQAFLSGVLLFIVCFMAIIILSLYTHILEKWHGVTDYFQYLYFLGYGIYPISLFFLKKIADSALPLQKKSLAFISLILIYISIISLIAQQYLI